MDLNLELIDRCKISTKIFTFLPQHMGKQNAHDFVILDSNINIIVYDTNIRFHFFSMILGGKMEEKATE